MDLFGVLTMLGGLALFLYGMNAMGDGLAKLSGGKLEKILEKLTSNLFMSVLLGAGVTAVIQSSSATTVMVVGFVNSGMMNLTQAVGVIMGANIGTTITSWILSLSGIEGGNLFTNLLKPSSFTPVLAVIGVIFIMYCKKENKKDIGNILIGFAILMTGMEMMSGAVAPLGKNPTFRNLLVVFENPVFGMLAGAILTAIIQSSSASVGILQAFSKTGSLTFGSAIPVIMGQNIGTCVTAIISSIGASKNAKRAALIHLYFNIIGTVLFMVVFYSINFFVHFEFLSSAINKPSIAVIHTSFNIVATLVLLPFSRFLVKLATLSIKDGKKKDTNKDFMLLDNRFLDKPSFAIEQSMNVTKDMAQLSKTCLHKAIGLLDKYDNNVADEIKELEDRIDHYEDELGTYLVKISGKSLSEKDSRKLSTMLHVIGNFERISDHAVNIMEAAKEMNEKKMSFSKAAKDELTIFTGAIFDIVDNTVQVFDTFDVEHAKMIEPLEEAIDDLNVELKNRHIQRLTNNECTIELGFVLSDITTSYERIADHCSNVAVCIIQVSEDGYDTHEYLDNIKSGNNEEFKILYSGYKSKYMLP